MHSQCDDRRNEQSLISHKPQNIPLPHKLDPASVEASLSGQKMDAPKQCWECLKRRLVCDFVQPACRKCRSRGVSCPGYDKKPLKWLVPGQTRSKGRRAKKETNLITLSLKDTSETTTIFEGIEYYNAYICPDSVATGVGGAANPFYLPHSAAPYIPAALRQTIVSVALGHRILQLPENAHADRSVLAAKLQNHRGAALQELAGNLGVAGSQTSDDTLVSVLSFLLAEIQQSISPSWRWHCDGAYAIIDMLGGMPDVILSRPPFRHLFRYFVLAEVMGSSTSPNVEKDRARRQLELVSIIPTLYGDGLWTTLPCPPELLSNIILVNHLRSRSNANNSYKEDRQAAALEVLERIRAFSVEKWTADVRVQRQHTNDGSRISLGAALSWDWQCVAYTFQSATALYCISALLSHAKVLQRQPTFFEDIQENTLDVSALRQAYRDNLICNLKEISTNSQTQLRKLVIWPLVIAGVEVDAKDDETQKFIIWELEWISKSLGTASPLVARDFLKRLWRSNWASGTDGRNWESVFDKPYCFVI